MKLYLKKLLSAVLCFALFLVMIPISASADDTLSGYRFHGSDFTGNTALQGKLDELFDMLPYSNYPFFTITGNTSCGNSGCDSCYNVNVANQHPLLKNTSVRLSDSAGGWSCFGFAQYVFKYLFGVEAGQYKTETQIETSTASRTQIEYASVDSVKSLLAGGKAGDIIQMWGYPSDYHTAVFLRAEDDGVIVFQNNYFGATYGRNRVTVSKLSYSTFANYYGTRISLYHARNYEDLYPETPNTQFANEAEAFVSYLNGRVGESFASNACQAFVWECVYNYFGRSNTKSGCCATKAWQNYGVSTSRDNIPLGAAVYFAGGNVTDSVCGQVAGHVGLYVGDGYIVHTWQSQVRKATIDWVVSCGYTYRGWGWQGEYVIDQGSYYLNVDGCLDGVRGDHTSPFGTFDVYINGTQIADDWTDYYEAWPVGTPYTVTDIKPSSGYEYLGVNYGSFSGTVGNEQTDVVLYFSTFSTPRIPAESITLDKTELTLTVGESTQLNATVLPLDSTDSVSFSSSNIDVAWATDSDLVVARAPGTAVITASAGDHKATCTVTVKSAEAPVSAAPLTLVAAYRKSTKTATVSIVTTEEIVLANYNVSLSWDTALFTLTAIANGQPELFSTFVPNTATGKISAYGGGGSNNVTVGAGKILASFTLTTADALDSGDYAFGLKVNTVADVDGETLSWKGEEIAGVLTVTPLTAESFLLRGADAFTVDFETPTAGDFTVTSDMACIVFCSDNTIYERLPAVKISDTTYAYTLPEDYDATKHITVAVKCDLTGDGEVDSTDALQTLRCSVGLRAFSAEDLLITDINQDTELDSTDALQILRASVGLRALIW